MAAAALYRHPVASSSQSSYSSGFLHLREWLNEQKSLYRISDFHYYFLKTLKESWGSLVYLFFEEVEIILGDFYFMRFLLFSFTYMYIGDTPTMIVILAL